MSWERYPRKPFRLPTVLTQEESQALLAQPTIRYRTSHRDRCLMQLMLNAGLRCAEAMNITVYDIEWTSGRVLVRQGKGRKDRILWINDTVLDDLRAWKQRRPCPENPLLFTTLRGRPLHASAIRAMVKRRALKAGLAYKDVHPHTLRHTYATELYRQCHDILVVKKALGHSAIQSTWIYTHMVDKEYETALRTLSVGIGTTGDTR